MKTATEMAKEAGFMLMADPDPDTGGWWECFDSEIETLVSLVRADERKAAQAEHEADKVIIEYHEATIKRLEARQWVGLSETDKERLSDLSADPRWNAWIGMEQTEALLKEKNT